MPRSSRGRSYLYQWQLSSDLRSTRKQRKEGPPERGSPTPERCMKETLESYRSGQESAASYDKALAAV
ncbi:hypothetical protein V6N13_124950 [Hibiscus sabdariffa]|uniref:Integrase n=1 Tax=Hibiscus sabdariffa TaxID=183260 RepID=A0ABR2U4N2_9ROSI